MSDPDDLYDVTQPPISAELAEQLLSGATPGIEATSMEAQLGVLFAAVRSPADSSELADIGSMVSAFQGAVVTAAGPSTARTRPMFKKILTGKAVATIGAVTLLSVGAAAAATGTVPSPFSSDTSKEVTADRLPEAALTHTAEHLVTPPTDDADDSADDADEKTNDATETEAPDADVADEETVSSEATGPDATGPAKYGLCTAYAAHTEHGDDADDTDEADDATPTESTETPVPFQNLADAAAAAGQSVEDFCADATTGKSASAPGQGDDSPSATAPGHGDDKPSTTAPGHTGEHAPEVDSGEGDDAPEVDSGESDDNPSVTAPGHDDENPSVTAGDHGEHGSGHDQP